MSELGPTEKSGRVTGKSALPSITDFVRGHRHVSKVPLPDSCAAANSNTYLFERRQVAGAVPNAFLKAREKAASEL